MGLNINGAVIGQYALDCYGITLKEKIAELVIPHLDKTGKTNMLDPKLFDIAIYDLSEQIGDDLITIAPNDIDDDKFFNMIKICVSNEIKATWYVAPANKTTRVKKRESRKVDGYYYYEEEQSPDVIPYKELNHGRYDL